MTNFFIKGNVGLLNVYQETTEYETQLAELYEQIGRLKVENDFLKKKCDVFRG